MTSQLITFASNWTMKSVLQSLAGLLLLAAAASAQTLDRTGFTLSFSDEFNSPLDLADWTGNDWQGGRKWYAHTPFGADFGDAGFVAANAYTEAGNLVLKASYTAGVGWQSALISSEFPTGAGFSQQYGYFEARMKLPSGQGTWPAFWLFGEGLNAGLPLGQRSITSEIDVMESYGSYPNIVHQAYHEYTPNPSGPGWTATAGAETTAVLANPADFHNFGVLVMPDFITWYIDDQQIQRMVTPEAAKQPHFVMLNYALGAGYGTSGVANPSATYVDYVRVSNVPEPTSAVLCSLGILGIFARRRPGGILTR
jgi:beta-glucanase (GH16 family)